ncbi:hypothetical protein BU16DRAFT_576463 [Lophium mytilinum]|uniref:Nucleolar protein 16 n=1 Tax=Lophium mytilinum TaxID=390894 RepID=A0A6A6RG41_9PEZI|nr:hypothetical protein BU16DRAFT_576463 [Lophium mytilinum]
MGRELQKKKNKSSISKVKKKPKSKKKVLHNPIIAANWNSHETLNQNYRRLGLTARLNHAAGGADNIHKPTSSELTSTSSKAAAPPSDSLRMPAPLAKTLTPQDARVERDPKTGAILRVLDDPTAPRRPNPLNDPLNELEEENEEEEWSGFAHVASSVPATTSVVQQLEEAAANGLRKTPRKQSTREEDWVERLVARHGDNYAAMFRDGKLNPMQQSEGDIRKRVKKWSEKHA